MNLKQFKSSKKIEKIKPKLPIFMFNPGNSKATLPSTKIKSYESIEENNMSNDFQINKFFETTPKCFSNNDKINNNHFKKRKKNLKIQLKESKIIPEKPQTKSIKILPKDSNYLSDWNDVPTQKDIRRIIEQNYDIGREIEQMVAEVDKEQAQRIFKFESLQSKMDKYSKTEIYLKNKKWKQFGDGLYSFFQYLQYFSIVFFIIFAISSPILFYNLTGSDKIMPNKVEKQSFFSKMSFGNLKKVESINYFELKNFLSGYIEKNLSDESLIDDNNENTNSVYISKVVEGISNKRKK